MHKMASYISTINQYVDRYVVQNKTLTASLQSTKTILEGFIFAPCCIISQLRGKDMQGHSQAKILVNIIPKICLLIIHNGLICQHLVDALPRSLLLSLTRLLS